MRNITRSDGVFTHTPARKFTAVFKSLTQLGSGALTLFYSGNNQRFNYYGGATQAERVQYGDNYSGYNENPGSSRYYGYNYNDYKNSISYIKYGFALGDAQISNQYYYYSGDGFGAGAGVSKSNLYLKKSWNITNRWGDIVKADIPLKHARVEIGLWYQRDRGHHYQDRYTPSTASYYFAYDELVHTRTATPYVQVKINASHRLIVTPGMKYLFVRRRFDNHLDHSSHTVAFREWLPSLGVNYALSPVWRLYANYTRNANPPAYNQFYSGQFNPDLKLQIANTIEMGGYWKAKRWSGRVTLFHTAFRNYILTTLVQEGSQPISQLSNAGNAVHEGASVSNNYQFLPWLSGFFNVGFLHARLTSANQPVPYAAHHTESLGINIHRGKLRASFAVRETGKRYVNLGGVFAPIGSAVSADASVSYRLSGAPRPSPGYGLKDASLKLTISNAFDRRNTLSLSGAASDPRYTLQAPRTVYASIEAHF
ncbi:MAG TPA: hypothetical protein DEP05_06065 [Betaproteobacteria bacterium]|nr:hypothetical protein [Betaproteobacteria bacterium]